MPESPRYLFVTMHTGCNLRCEHCTYWQRGDNREYDRVPIVEEYAELSPGGAVVTCGGEATLDMEDWLALGRQCRARGLRLLSVTNGTHITERNAERVVDEGPVEVTVSIDASTPEAHDAYRGVRGSWDAATRAVRALVRARGRGGPRVYVMMIVGERSWRDIPAMYELALGELGADKLKLNMAQPTFGLVNGQDDWYARNVIRDIDGFMETMRDARARHGVEVAGEWERAVESYWRDVGVDVAVRRGWRSPGKTSEALCNSAERNVMVDERGVMRLCFSPRYPGRRWVQHGDLREFWDWAWWRDAMRRCRAYCGISHSVRATAASPADVERSWV